MTDDDAGLLAQLVEAARERSDGHLTIMKFTTNWRVQIDVQHVPIDPIEVDGMAVGATFAEAARAALAREREPTRAELVAAWDASLAEFDAQVVAELDRLEDEARGC
jgi:hypothetical protein